MPVECLVYILAHGGHSLNGGSSCCRILRHPGPSTRLLWPSRVVGQTYKSISPMRWWRKARRHTQPGWPGKASQRPVKGEGKSSPGRGIHTWRLEGELSLPLATLGLRVGERQEMRLLSRRPPWGQFVEELDKVKDLPRTSFHFPSITWCGSIIPVFI